MMPPQDTKGPPSSLSDAISMLMENPQIISTVASALGNMSTKSEEASEAEQKHTREEIPKEVPSDPPKAVDAPPADLSSLVSSLSPLMSGLSHGHSSGGQRGESETDRREALLCALKPYVSEGRRDAIDYIIRISRMSEVLKTIQS